MLLFVSRIRERPLMTNLMFSKVGLQHRLKATPFQTQSLERGLPNRYKRTTYRRYMKKHVFS